MCMSSCRAGGIDAFVINSTVVFGLLATKKLPGLQPITGADGGGKTLQ